MANTTDRYRLVLMLEKEESKNRTAILKSELIERFPSESEARAEFKALFDEIMEPDDED